MKMSSTARIVLSLVALATSLLLIAGTLGFFPDRAAGTIDARTRLSEALSITFASMATHVDTDTVEKMFQSVADRNADLRSIGLRRRDGILLVDIGNHNEVWDPNQGEKSSEVQIIVPVEGSGGRWGSVEITFDPAVEPGLAGFLHRDEFTLTAFMALTLSIGYWWYLRRVLKQLNPSRVIPGRVREAFDSLAEGVLVLDNNGTVVLANRSFEKCTGRLNEDLMGRKTDTLPFTCRDEDENTPLPWCDTAATNATISGRLLGLDERTFSVSSVPIVDERGMSRGVLASFEDVTQLRNKKEELRQIVGHLHESTAEIQRQNRELEQLANFDPLTGCHNRRSFFEKFDILWKAAMRYEAPISAIMVDIDHFKSINDNHGHSVGDKVLRTVSAALQSKMREVDLLCRYGGEEFAVLLPHTDISQAEVAAERYRRAIAELQIPGISVTASLGVSALSENPADPQELLDQADNCLYVAKRNGRNQVVRWDQADHKLVGESEGRDDKAAEIEIPVERQAIPYHAVSALVSALAFRDQQTAEHSRRVADLAVAMGEGLLSYKDCYTLEMAALLHDIGKIGVPDAILLKPGKLSEEQWQVMNSYAQIGAEIVHASFASPELTALVRTYRQRYDDKQSSKKLGRGTNSCGRRCVRFHDTLPILSTHVDARSSDYGTAKKSGFAIRRRACGSTRTSEWVYLAISNSSGIRATG